MALQLRPYQKEAVNAVYAHLRERDDNPCVVLPTGCHAKGHPILMFDGNIKNVEEIVVGDIVMGADSTPRTVIALTKGREQMAKIIPRKGKSFVVNVNHVLSLVSTTERANAQYACHQGGGEITNISVKDYLQKSKSWKHLRKLYSTGVDFAPAQATLPMPPYILGLLIGDGSITHGVGITTADIEIAETFIDYAYSMGCKVRTVSNGSKAMTYYASVTKGKTNPIAHILRELGLFGHKFDQKFIPKRYLTASKEDRMQLFAGLVDTDGFCAKSDIDYVTGSKLLAVDIAFLARSLGFHVHEAVKVAKCQTGKQGVYDRLHISGDFSKVPFIRFKHQITFIERKMKKNCLRTGFDVELLPEDDFYGFTIDGDHLYVDGNFMVHHNCGKSIVIGKIASDAVSLWNGRVLILAHVKELLEQNAGKVKALCPDIPVGIYSAGLGSRDTNTPIVVAGIQSVYNKADALGAFDLIIVDECFPAGTMIDTPRGKVAIEDLYVGQPVCHALGVGKIEAISVKTVSKLLEIELSNGESIKCTHNHPFFTENGWQKAETLAVGTRLFCREDVSCLRQGVLPEDLVQRQRKKKMHFRNRMEQTDFLFAEMSGYKPEEKSCPQTNYNLGRRSKKSEKELFVLRNDFLSEILSQQTSGENCVEQAGFLFNLLLQESSELYVQSGNSSKSCEYTESEEIQTKNKRWKRQGTNYTAENTRREVECTNGVCGNNQYSPALFGCAKLLQGGCCTSRKNDGDPVGRSKSSNIESSAGGQKSECFSDGVRVVGVTSIELSGSIPVFNLQLKGHPTYYANGVLVHNCHLIAPEGEGMYRTFLNDMKLINPNVRVIGFTATPYRLKGGLICKPENILNTVCYEMGVKEMIQQGYLSPLVTRSGKKEVNLSGLHVRGGEFINTEIVAAMDKEEVTNAACSEIVRLAEDRKSVLIFATSVEHCQHIADRLRHLGQECAIITGDTPAGERAELLDRFKGKSVPADLLGGVKPPLKYLVNVNVLTTGFDAPNTDCVVLLRPTASPGLLVQMVGRGFRLSPETEKENTLVLDYGENILRHGPIDCITVKEQGKGKGEAPAKKCPECLALIHAGYGKCPECGYEFPPPETSNLSHKASSAGILSGQSVFTDYAVNKVFYSVHSKKNADETVPRTMRIDYEIGFHQYKSEWVCPEHSGYARSKFIKWWGERCALGCDVPKTAKEAVEAAESGLLAIPKSIRVKAVTGEKFERICGWELGERPVMREPGEDDIPDWQSNSPADLGVNHDWEPFDDEIPF